MDRRGFLAALLAGTIATLTGCAGGKTAARWDQRQSSPPPASPGRRVRPPRPAPIPPAHPGAPRVFTRASQPTQQIALTIDDGVCDECVGGYVAFAEHTGIPITFSPNGVYHGIWDNYADRLRPLVEAGQVQIGNHTWSHRDMTGQPAAAVRADIERNEEWIQRTFGVTARPWLRPPYGFRNASTDALCAALGYTNILMWNGSFGDSVSLTPAVLMDQASRYLQPGTIMLGHANHATILGLFDEVRALLAERRLQPVTLDTMFRTSRAVG